MPETRHSNHHRPSSSENTSPLSQGGPGEFLFNKQFPHLKGTSPAWRQFYEAVREAMK